MKNYLKLIFFGEIWWYGWGITLLITLMILGIVLNANSRNPEPVLLTATPQPSATFTPAPTETPAPTPPMPTPDETMVSIPPLNEMCWTVKAVTSFLETDGIFQDMEWIPSEDANYELSYLNEDDPTSTVSIAVNLEKDCETCCITKISVMTDTVNTDEGNWARAGAIHGFLSMMADADYLFFVDEYLGTCFDGVKVSESETVDKGYYNGRKVECFSHEDYIQIETIIWNGAIWVE